MFTILKNHQKNEIYLIFLLFFKNFQNLDYITYFDQKFINIILDISLIYRNKKNVIFMPKINHFEINADDPKRAINFYKKTFGWDIEKWQGPVEYWTIKAGDKDEEGIDGGIQRREDSNDQIFNYISVISVNAYKEKIEENGGTIVSPKIVVPGVGYFYMFKDTEGNKLGIMQEDETAK